MSALRTSCSASLRIRFMSNLKSLSARILALALYCRDSGQVPFSVCRVGSFSSAGKLLGCCDGGM